ncbi:MAG TPA: TetR/AcrR family transcriptional regulator [Vicinamibacterales bacterium]|nr:TetR/AcrR family transcriptional regulator [Vicinamibacterales bacterium]
MAPRTPASRRPARKPAHRYHHGNLRPALIHEAVITIRDRGVEALTLRGIGRTLGVSRTALYRHFADKSALLAAVAREGFQRFRRELLEAWNAAGRGGAGLDAMGIAYVRFAITNPSHYRVMFGRFEELRRRDPDLQADAAAAFQVLVDALDALQRTGDVQSEDLSQLARFIWAMVHGVAMLTIDGQLGTDPAAADTLIRFAMDRVHRGLGGSAISTCRTPARSSVPAIPQAPSASTAAAAHTRARGTPRT